mmetsp:Transcript_47425/g.96898  ORF Transcript_47425/g.96898 Transcript_47425/m.96898 type:complete len:86 (+) Transcript_47425:129-386(+)
MGAVKVTSIVAVKKMTSNTKERNFTTSSSIPTIYTVLYTYTCIIHFGQEEREQGTGVYDVKGGLLRRGENEGGVVVGLGEVEAWK